MNVPKLRFKEFDGEWARYYLGENAEIKGRVGWKSLKRNEYIDEGPNMIAGKHINNGTINWEKVDHIPKWRYEESPEIMLENDDVIFSKDGSLGNPAIIRELPGESTINSTMMLVRTGDDIDSEFFYQILLGPQFKRLIYLKVSGSSIPHLFQADMKEFSFLAPLFEEQKKISQFLSVLDKKIQLQQQKIDLLQEQKKGYMQKIFNQEIRFKDGGHYYMKWAEYILNDLGETYTGLSGKTKEDFGVGEHSFVTYVNVFKNLFAKKFGVEKVIFKENENQNYVKTDDLFFTTSSETPKEVGMASIWKHESCNLHLNSFCFGYRVTNPKILPDFLAISLRSEYMRKKITILAQGSTRYNISKTELMKEKVNVPCLEEQKRIVEFYLKLDTSIELEKKKLDILKEQKQGFMQQMFI